MRRCDIVASRVSKKRVVAIIIISLLIMGICSSTLKTETKSDLLEFPFPKYFEEELRFPLAFHISVYKDGPQLVQLLRLIYRPFNLYCIHVDQKNNESLQNLVGRLATRYNNIIAPSKFIEVNRGKFSVLESELLCMEALYRRKTVPWKYFINLTGQELPLKTNLEIVRILKQLRGANLVEKIPLEDWKVPKEIGPPPHGIHLWKGAVHIAVVRDFVKFALYDRRALDLLEYLKGTFIPVEIYFATLNNDHELRAPGGYSGDLIRDDDLHPFLTRYKLWYTESECHGTFLRTVCIFSMDDIPNITSPTNRKLFVNKFVFGINDDVYQYMCTWFQKRTQLVYSQPTINPLINLTYYSQLTVVSDHY